MRANETGRGERSCLSDSLSVALYTKYDPIRATPRRCWPRRHTGSEFSLSRFTSPPDVNVSAAPGPP